VHKMTRVEFLLEIDEILGLRAGMLRGNEELGEQKNGDSTAHFSLNLLAEANNSAQISPVGCSTVADLLRLAQVQDDSGHYAGHGFTRRSESSGGHESWQYDVSEPYSARTRFIRRTAKALPTVANA
jgi:hypothetical protein